MDDGIKKLEELKADLEEKLDILNEQEDYPLYDYENKLNDKDTHDLLTEIKKLSGQLINTNGIEKLNNVVEKINVKSIGRDEVFQIYKTIDEIVCLNSREVEKDSYSLDEQKPGSDMNTENTDKVALTIDICSSTEIMEDLLKNQMLYEWKNLLKNLGNTIDEKLGDIEAEVYKFTGDGWIVLFSPPYKSDKIFHFVKNIHFEYNKLYNEKIKNKLDTSLDREGLTFGIDEGRVELININDKPREYIGRALNMSTRLQGEISNTDLKHNYQLLITTRAFNKLNIENLDIIISYEETTRTLKNINAGKGQSCYRLRVDKIGADKNELTIIKAKYGTKNSLKEYTSTYEKLIYNNQINTEVCNDIVKDDPAKGKPKTLWIDYYYNGKKHHKEVSENDILHIP